MAVVVLVLELAIRLFGAFLPGAYRTSPYIEIDAELGWRHIPSQVTWFRTREYVSRSDVNAERRVGAAVAGTRSGPRILLLGDSFAEAAQVPYELGMPHRTAALLKEMSIEIVNDAVSAYGTDQELLVLERDTPTLRPDAVVLVFSVSTDVSDNYAPFYALRPTKTKPSFELDAAGGLMRVANPGATPGAGEEVRALLARSAALTLLKSGLVDNLVDRGGGAARDREIAVLDRPTPAWEEAWRLTERLIEEAARAARASAIPLVLVIAPDACQVHRETCGARPELASSDLPQQRLARLGARLGVRVVDPTPLLRRHASEREQLYFPQDLHWTARGHELMADVVATALRDVISAKR